jgi:hypothetical protein
MMKSSASAVFGKAGFAAALLGLSVAGCGERGPGPAGAEGLLPAAARARALHCYLVLTLTIDQMAEFDGPGRQGGVVAGRGAEDLLRARARVAAELDEALLDELRRDPWSRLEAMLAGFDADGDGQLATAAEVEVFNRHVTACRGLWSGA